VSTSIKTLDALVLASMDPDAAIQRIAALWCREMADTLPSSPQSLARWVKRDYGQVLDKENIEHLSLKLLDEIRQQTRLRARRKKLREIHDPLSKRAYGERLGALMNSALGPARAWASRRRIQGADLSYIAGKVTSGLVVGIIPVQMRLARIVNPCLLVYRERGHEPKSYWISGRIGEVDEALVWLVPKDVQDLVAQYDGPDLQVELDYERQACRVVTPYGSKLIPWRGLQPECE
jgi:hypothetical protein